MRPDAEFPEKYTALREEIAEVGRQLAAIDRQIAYWEQQPGGYAPPRPALGPNGRPVIQPPTRDEQLESLRNQREQLQSTTFSKVEKAVAPEQDAAMKQAVLATMREDIFGNEFKEGRFENMTHEQLQRAKAQLPPLTWEKSQDYMDALRERQPEPIIDSPTTEQQPTRTDPTYRVSLNLIYSQVAAPEAEIASGTEKNEAGTKKSLAELASQSLRYSLISREATPDPPTEPETTPYPGQQDEEPPIEP